MFGLLRFLGISVVAIGVLIALVVQLLLPALVTAAIDQSAVFAGQPVSIQVRTSLAGVLCTAGSTRSRSVAPASARARFRSIGWMPRWRTSGS